MEHDIFNPRPLAIIEAREPVDRRAEARRRARDALITLALTIVACAGVVWLVLSANSRIEIPREAIARETCPAADIRLNAYERELQQRECEARTHNVRARESARND